MKRLVHLIRPSRPGWRDRAWCVAPLTAAVTADRAEHVTCPRCIRPAAAEVINRFVCWFGAPSDDLVAERRENQRLRRRLAKGRGKPKPAEESDSELRRVRLWEKGRLTWKQLGRLLIAYAPMFRETKDAILQEKYRNLIRGRGFVLYDSTEDTSEDGSTWD